MRVEQLYPFPLQELEQMLSTFAKQTPVYWVQEEPQNNGAWPFIRSRIGDQLRGNGIHPLYAIARAESASPATGSKACHKLEQKQILDAAFAWSFSNQSEGQKSPPASSKAFQKPMNILHFICLWCSQSP